MSRVTNFFVVGLPRSRTSWMANFLTYDGHYCYHEAVNGCKNMTEYKEKLGNFVGDSSTALMLMDIPIHFPDAKIVKIISSVRQSVTSSREIYPDIDPDWIDHLDDKLWAMDCDQIYVVDIDDLNQQLPAIWKWLFGYEVDQERLDLLLGQRIQMLDPYAFDEQALESFFNINNNLEL